MNVIVKIIIQIDPANIEAVVDQEI